MIQPKPGPLDALIHVNPSDDRLQSIRAIIEQIYSSTGINLKSVLDDKHVAQVARALAYAEMYPTTMPLLQQLITTLLELRVSKNGRGRDDMIEALRSALAVEEDSPSLLKKLLGV